MNIKENIARSTALATGLEATELMDMLEVPPDPKMGDLALPCFRLAKTLRQSPQKIAQDLAQKIGTPSGVATTELQGGYINFYFDRAAYAGNTLASVFATDQWGSSDMGQNRCVVIDYSSVNIAKPFHIGHLSSTAIGNSLYKIYQYLGFKPVGINHLGDWGTQFGKLITAYKLWGNDQEIERDSVSAMLKLYVRFHEEAKKDEALNEEGRAWFKKIEDGDTEALRIFGWFSDLTLREAKRVYEMLGIQFDYFTGESFYNDKMQPVLDELKEKNLMELDEGAYIVRLEEYSLPPCIVLKTDGATLYSTRDLAAAEYRKQTFNFYKALYVVAYQQSLHFRQLFAVLEKMGKPWAGQCEHVAFGMVSLEDGTLSTREGKIVLLEDVLNRSIEKSLAIINEKNPELENKYEVAHQVGIGAVLFSTLSAGRIKDITFSFDRVLNFEGETGPYVQFAHARASSILRKYDGQGGEADYTALENDDAFAVIKQIADFPSAVVAAADKNEPSFITRHITLLAQYFNKYYYEYRIMDSDEKQTCARIQLTKAVQATIKTGLNLLGIAAPERM
ncbi:MAG: arginine--tRNA ligase [Eubacteriales bacterium]